jgi:hypothetical protein
MNRFLVVLSVISVSSYSHLSESIAQQSVGCYQVDTVKCAVCIGVSPYDDLERTCRSCGACSGNPNTPPSPSNMAMCPCDAALKVSKGSVVLGRPCQQPGIEDNGCRNDYTLKTKIVDGEVVLDSVVCGTRTVCNPTCRGRYDENGNYFPGSNHCVDDSDAPAYTHECNEYVLAGTGC